MEKPKKKYIEDITRWFEDMNFSSSGENNILRKSAWVSKILFFPREDKIHIFKLPCNVLFII